MLKRHPIMVAMLVASLFSVSACESNRDKAIKACSKLKDDCMTNCKTQDEMDKCMDGCQTAYDACFNMANDG